MDNLSSELLLRQRAVTAKGAWDAWRTDPGWGGGRKSTPTRQHGLKEANGHPYVIFLDLNLPPSSPIPLTQEWFKRIADPILKDREKEGVHDPWNLLIFSNYPTTTLMTRTPRPLVMPWECWARTPKSLLSIPRRSMAFLMRP